MNNQRTVDLSTPTGQFLVQLSQRLKDSQAGGGWTGVDLVTVLGSGGGDRLDWMPELGTVVQLRAGINAGYLARSGTVVGCGAIHPDTFPYVEPGLSTSAYPVVLVTTGPVVAAWSLESIEPGICSFHAGHVGSCAPGTPQWTGQHLACRRASQVGGG